MSTQGSSWATGLPLKDMDILRCGALPLAPRPSPLCWCPFKAVSSTQLTSSGNRRCGRRDQVWAAEGARPHRADPSAGSPGPDALSADRRQGARRTRRAGRREAAHGPAPAARPPEPGPSPPPPPRCTPGPATMRRLPRAALLPLQLALLVAAGAPEAPVSAPRSLVWGPGLRAGVVLPVRYFYLQAVNAEGQHLTRSPPGSVGPPAAASPRSPRRPRASGVRPPARRLRGVPPRASVALPRLWPPPLPRRPGHGGGGGRRRRSPLNE